MLRLILLLIVSLLCLHRLHAQPTPDSLATDSISVDASLERILDRRPSETSSAQLVEQLTDLVANPLDLNRASASALATVPGVSLPLAHRIVRYRSEEMPFISVDDLGAVKGMTRDRIQALRPFVEATAPPNAELTAYPSPPSVGTMASNLEFSLLQQATRDLDLGRGYVSDSSTTSFEGSPVSLTTRMRLYYERRVQAALTLDKDAGEPLRWAPATDTYGFDHVAGSLALRDLGRLQTFVLGDFTVELGQGLALWQGLTFGKGRDPVSSIVREGRGVVPFHSTSENRFFRGAAGTVSLTPSLSLTGFVSRRDRDATLDSSLAEAPSDTVPARTLSSGGLHRTPNEIDRKGTFGTTTYGGAVAYHSPSLHAGLTGYHSQFDRPLRPGPQPYRRFDLSGTQTSMFSAYATAHLGNYVLFGEAARSDRGVLGAVGGVGLDHPAGVEAVLLARRYPRDFDGLFSGAFGGGGAPQNETGIYAGLRLQIAPNWWVSGYIDQYRSPWLRFGMPQPTSGLDTRLVLETDLRPWLSTYLQVRADRTEEGTVRPGPHGRPLQAVETNWRHSARWHVEYEFSDRLTLRSRLATTRMGSSTGLLFYQGIGLQAQSDLEMEARVLVFDTDGYESRLYAYERDLRYSFSVPVLFGQGQRSYVLLQYTPRPSISVRAKYGVTWYPHRDSIGSGLNTTEGNQNREIRLQLRWQL
ncbi:MAG: helix-hairpin-helix domain-containing protein [Salinibacter sp.]